MFVLWRSYGNRSAKERRQVIAHELTHAALAKRTGGRVPLWLSEGIAMYASGDKRAGDAGALLSGGAAPGPVQAEVGREGALARRAWPSPTRSTACRAVPLTFAYSYSSAAAYAIANKHGGAKALLRLYSAFNSAKIKGKPGRKLTDKRLAQGPARRRSARSRTTSRPTPERTRPFWQLACSGAMPELPEVETIRRHLAPHVEGRVLEAVEVLDERWSRPLAPAELEAARSAAGASSGSAAAASTSSGSSRDDVYLLMHLRMTGTLLLDPDGRRHTRVRFDLGDHELVFDDPRRFGTGELALGPEALDRVLRRAPRRRAARARLHRRAPPRARQDLPSARKGIPSRSEARRRGRQHLRRRGAVPRPRAPAPAREQAHARPVRTRSATASSSRCWLGLEHKGATIDDFRDPYGVSGTFQDQFLVHTREHEPCPNCGNPIRKLRVAGRGTYVCERCQTAAARPPQGDLAARSHAGGVAQPRP